MYKDKEFVSIDQKDINGEDDTNIDSIVFYGLHKHEYSVTKLTAKLLSLNLKDINSILFLDLTPNQYTTAGYTTRLRKAEKAIKEHKPKLAVDIHTISVDDYEPWGGDREFVGEIITWYENVFGLFSRFLTSQGFSISDNLEFEANYFKRISEYSRANEKFGLSLTKEWGLGENGIATRCIKLDVPYMCVEVNKPKQISNYITKFLEQYVIRDGNHEREGKTRVE